MSTNLLRCGSIALAGIALALAAGPLGLIGDYAQFIIASIAIYTIVVLSMTMLAGSCGIWSLGHPVFMALGAYVAANLSTKGVPVEIIMVTAVVLSSCVGFILGLSAGRFSVLYFGLLTLALSLTGTEIVGHWREVTGGDEGMHVGQAVSLFLPQPLDTNGTVAFGVLLATAVFLFSELISSGRYGRRWLAVKGQRIASTAVGLRPHIENARAFGTSAGIASLAGVAMAFVIGYLDPEAFNLSAGVMLIVATVVGGIGSFVGALFGASFITLVPELARALPGVSSFVYGAAMVLVLLLLGDGIVPATRRLIRSRVARPTTHSGGVARQAVNAEAMRKLVSELLPPARDTLSLKNVSVSFQGLKALQDVSFDVPPGTAVGLIGPNGAGKTTLLNVLSGFVRPLSSASVSLGEADLLALPPYGRAALGFGRTFQHAELFDELPIRDMLVTVAELAVSLRRTHHMQLRDPEAVADRILDGLGLRSFANAYPSELPFGIQKVVDIGRVLAIGAFVITLDEPFSGLDKHEYDELRAILQGMRLAGVSFLIIDHAVQEVLSLVDKVVVLNFGCQLAMGAPDAIRRDPAVMEAYFGSTVPIEGTIRGESATFGGSAISVIDVEHRYDGVLALSGVSLDVRRGSFTAVLGPNGAGKSTLAQIMGGMLAATRGRVIVADAAGTRRRTGRSYVDVGAVLVPERRRLFGQLSVSENLLLGAYGAGVDRAEINLRFKATMDLMPRSVQEGRHRAAATLSGGEQQMLAVGRALMAAPRVIILDEPSLGLAPILIDAVYELLSTLNKTGVTVVVVEQIATHAMRYADHVAVLDHGAIVQSGSMTDHTTTEALRVGYLGYAA
ncbi:ATP-binding cassette domain-containing protein [Paraburkholderia sp. BL10I2N1]|uniref:branched-chain amino acid ABC transporter ATP-binding protein/permease n=1 Tax=Paraburkholderia sp. BL10I2N1 TaxID=1938796 RepID=UPI00105C285C|nr:ATP-binding cassette domain-containing protein [Paraburkholderia sp. BL10I2N1]TDN61963.1 monosaccharide ABC transporter ATP-binding protein (CUT2 family) [Paraburkholderia sp. BL10I2N1]